MRKILSLALLIHISLVTQGSAMDKYFGDEKISITWKSCEPSSESETILTDVFINAKPVSTLAPQKMLFGKEVMPLGKDVERRTHVKNIGWPYCAHGVINMKFGSKTYRGTGTLIAPNVIITAAHNLYDHREGYAHSIEFLAGANGKNCNAKSSVSRFYFPDEYKGDDNCSGSKKFRNDYGIAILDKPMWTNTGHFGLSVVSEKQLELIKINVTGYPAVQLDKGARDYQLWGMAGKIARKDENDLIFYDIDTEGGQSGSGIWYRDGSNFFVIGTHVLGDYGKNGGILLTNSRINKINDWIKQDNPDANTLISSGPSTKVLQDPNYTLPLYEQINQRGHLRLMQCLLGTTKPPLNLITKIEGVTFNRHNDSIIMESIIEDDTEWKNRELAHIKGTGDDNYDQELAGYSKYEEKMIAHKLACEFSYEYAQSLKKAIMKKEELNKAFAMINKGDKEGYKIASKVGITIKSDGSYVSSIGDSVWFCFENYCKHMVRTKVLLDMYTIVKGEHVDIFKLMYDRNIKNDLLYSELNK